MSQMKRDNPEKKKTIGLNLATHKIMLEDKKRTLSYKKAIDNVDAKNKVFLDLGCGTGILSFFAARNNFNKIFAVDNDTKIIECAKKTAELNNLDKKIGFIKEDIKRLRLPEKIDILVHEQIGLFLWNEDMVSKVKYIRENYLKNTGIIIPERIELYFVPVNLRSNFEDGVSFWKRKIYGFDFKKFGSEYFNERFSYAKSPLLIQLHNTKNFLSPEQLGYTIDFRKEKGIPRKIEVSFRINKTSILTGVCVYFKIRLDRKTSFSTRPQKKNTHWGQIFLPNFYPQTIKKNCALRFMFFPKKKEKDWRWRSEVLPR